MAADEARAARAGEYASALARMLRVPTVRQEGCEPVFEQMRSLLAELFPLAWEAGGARVIEGSVVLRWRGARPDGALLLMSHHDVVQAPAQGWTHPPFSGDIAEGRVWGRGAVDVKGNLFCILRAVEELLAEGFVPATDVYVVSSGCEEVGGNPAVADWLRREGVDLTLVLDEGLSVQPNPLDPACAEAALVSVAEKGAATIRCVATGPGGHAMNPPRDSPLPRLGGFMHEVDGAPLFAPGEDGGQTALAFTTAGGSERTSMMPSEAWAVCNAHVPPGVSVTRLVEALGAVARRHNVHLEVQSSREPSAVTPTDSRGYRHVARAVGEVYPGVPVVPYVLPGGTDTRHFAGLAPAILRFVALRTDAQQQGSVHGIDENVFVDALPDGVDFFKVLVRGWGEE